jgi:hypothetical protein
MWQYGRIWRTTSCSFLEYENRRQHMKRSRGMEQKQLMQMPGILSRKSSRAAGAPY